MRFKPQIIFIEQPPMGGKIWLLQSKGLFVLEQCPGTLRTLALTHAGSGTIEFIDGIPNEDGCFPDDDMPEPEPFTVGELRTVLPPGRAEADLASTIQLSSKIDEHKAWGSRNGRSFYVANPAVMGSWMMDGGFIHGLCVRATGIHDSVNSIGSIVWMPHKPRKAS